MGKNLIVAFFICFAINIGIYPDSKAQIGKRFPSEKKIVKDPVTGVQLTFLTSTPKGDGKIYQTHNQWTSDGRWIIFRSDRVKGEVMAVNEESGDLVQVSEGGYTGMLNVARQSMKLYFMRKSANESAKNTLEIVEVDLAKLFADSQSGKLRETSVYQRICGTTPPELEAGGDMALDGGEEWAWFRVGQTEARKHLPSGTVIEGNFGPRNMGAGPAGIAGMNVRTGEIKYVVSVPFQIATIPVATILWRVFAAIGTGWKSRTPQRKKCGRMTRIFPPNRGRARLSKNCFIIFENPRWPSTSIVETFFHFQ